LKQTWVGHGNGIDDDDKEERQGRQTEHESSQPNPIKLNPAGFKKGKSHQSNDGWSFVDSSLSATNKNIS